MLNYLLVFHLYFVYEMKEHKHLCEFLNRQAYIDLNDTELVNTPELKLWIRWGSMLNSNYLVVKGRYIFTGDISLDKFTSLLNEKRIQWDHNVIEYEMVKRVLADVQVVRYVTEAPSPFSLPTEYVEKHIRFKHNAVRYGYCSSVPDKIYPVKKGYTRGTTIFAGSILKHEERVTVYNSFSQVQLNVWYLV